MLIMDASVTGTKARQTEVAHSRHAVGSPVDIPVSKVPKALAPQVLSAMPADEAPMKPVFVKREKRETRTLESSGSTEPNKRSSEGASGGSIAKKPLCSFDDE